MKNLIILLVAFFAIACSKGSDIEVSPSLQHGDCEEHLLLQNGTEMAGFGFEEYWSNGYTDIAFLDHCLVLIRECDEIVFRGQWFPHSKECDWFSLVKGEDEQIEIYEFYRIELITDTELHIREGAWTGDYNKITK